MKMNGISQPRQLTVTGLALPYLFIIIFAVIIAIMPGTADQKTNKIGAVAFGLPFIAAAIGAILVGIGSAKEKKLKKEKMSFIHAFLFGFTWTALLHFFITLYLFMMIVYGYAGLNID